VEDASHAPIEQIFEITNFIINHAIVNRERILVHCFGGVSRSATVVIAHLIKDHCMTLAEAFATVFSARPWIRPNEGFWAKLQLFEVDEHVVGPARDRVNSLLLNRTISDMRGGMHSASFNERMSAPANVVLAPQRQIGMLKETEMNATAPVRRKNVLRSLIDRILSSPSPASSKPKRSQAFEVQEHPVSPSLVCESSNGQFRGGMRSAMESPLSPAIQTNSYFTNRSRALSILDDDQNAEGSLTHRVMRNARLERVTDWLSIRRILNSESYFV
jgi:hypothetical protein